GSPPGRIEIHVNRRAISADREQPRVATPAREGSGAVLERRAARITECRCVAAYPCMKPARSRGDQIRVSAGVGVAGRLTRDGAIESIGELQPPRRIRLEPLE